MPSLAVVLELARKVRFALAIPRATVGTLGGVPLIHLSWVFLGGMQLTMSEREWNSYVLGLDEVKVG